METQPVTSTSPTPATSSMKEEGGRTPPGEGRGSPPPNCAICLGQCQNKSFTDSCLHQFCFNCLLTWSKIKAECPLCKQNFKSIIHNVRSNHQYEEYLVEQRETESLVVEEPPFPSALGDYGRRFRYRTTITLPRREGTALQHLLLGPRFLEDVALPPQPEVYRRQLFRRTVYRHNLWARLLPDFTGRFRECTPEFYRNNEAQKLRLAPWLTRELHYLLSPNQTTYVLARILDLLPVHDIRSPEFRDEMLPYFGERTEHFLHEFYCFASTPFDVLGYDRNVQYGIDPRIQRLDTHVDHVISSSDSDSVDSDIVMVSSSEPAQQSLGPSRSGATPVYPPAYSTATDLNNVIPIETISHSDSDDSSSEVMVVGYLKPPQDRTPEVVDLLASGTDSDVVVQETTPSASTSAQADVPLERPLVKLTLKRRRTALLAPDSDSDADSDYRPPSRPRRGRSQGSASTVSTRGGTPSPSFSDASWNPSSFINSSVLSDEDYFINNLPTERSRSKQVEKRKETKSRKNRKKIKRRSSSRTSTSRTPPLNAFPEDPSRSLTPPLDGALREWVKEKGCIPRKRKSNSGKDVKSSKHRKVDSTSLDQPSTSGTQTRIKEEEKARFERERRRKMRSVVMSAMLNKTDRNLQEDVSSQSSASETLISIRHSIQNLLANKESNSHKRTSIANNPASARNTEDRSDSPGPSVPVEVDPGSAASPHTHRLQPLSDRLRIKRPMILSSSDSDDDLPLNLTLKKHPPPDRTK